MRDAGHVFVAEEVPPPDYSDAIRRGGEIGGVSIAQEQW
jgi:hypothetical protein